MHRSGFRDLIKVASRTEKWNLECPWKRTENLRKNAFFAVELHVTFKTWLLSPVIKKDILPTHRNVTSAMNVYPTAIVSMLVVRLQDCIKQHVQKFSILSRGHSKFHLSVLEATFIKSFKPNLSKQKEFVYNLKLL